MNTWCYTSYHMHRTRSYEVVVSPRNIWRCHVDQVLSLVEQLFSDPQLQIPIIDTTMDFAPAEPKPSMEC